ncbi:hypothetical protein ACIG0D_25625 [Streptomyces sp. NPDC052773]|uniref:hypothetical protein n=1 Tax=Streptomyces sp. NPDC052773 TaxID=3365693 RepID=UPI0037D90618
MTRCRSPRLRRAAQVGAAGETSRGAGRTVRAEPELLGGVRVISADGRQRSDGAAVPLTAVPYDAWANREPGPTRVWVPER